MLHVSETLGRKVTRQCQAVGGRCTVLVAVAGTTPWRCPLRPAELRRAARRPARGSRSCEGARADRVQRRLRPLRPLRSARAVRVPCSAVPVQLVGTSPPTSPTPTPLFEIVFRYTGFKRRTLRRRAWRGADARAMDDPERMAREAAACALANGNSTPPAAPYCAGTYDSWQCWPHARANSTAYRPCPAFVPGFSPELMAHKECMANGTWFLHPETGHPWSNYTTCIKPEDDMSDIIAVYECGYSVSLVALLLSLFILLYFKNLRCARITVHMNLFASFAANNALWLVWYGLVVPAPATLRDSPAWCCALNGVLQYAMLTTYTWMLCEGLYLHTVLVSAFVSERRLLRALLLLGWALPAPAAAVYAGRRAAAGDGLCWSDEGSPRPELAALACGALLLNVGFLCNIVRVLCTKLRAGGSVGGAGGPPRPSATALHALRATCLLAPLLGLQYLLMLIRPEPSERWWLAYEFASALTTSLQGLCVAVLYCFCNGEVLAQLRRRWRVLTFRPRANSATATTVSFVRSGAGAEDKV